MEGDQTWLAARVEDALRLSQKRSCFLGFLDEGQASFCRTYLSRREGQFLFWGGHEDAERTMLGFFPPYKEPAPAAFPIQSCAFLYRKQYSLTHRDFLGAFLSLGVERDFIGDILVGEGLGVAFFREEMAGYFSQNLDTIGRVGVKVVSPWEGELPVAHTFLDMSGVIASQRLDCITAFLCRTSREKAAGLIRSGTVSINHRETLSSSAQVGEGDIISVRRHGRFVVDQLGPLTSKGRLVVKCRKYQ